MSASAINILVNTTHMISPSPTYFFTRVLFTITLTCHTAHLRSYFTPKKSTYGILNRHDPS